MSNPRAETSSCDRLTEFVFYASEGRPPEEDKPDPEPPPTQDDPEEMP